MDDHIITMSSKFSSPLLTHLHAWLSTFENMSMYGNYTGMNANRRDLFNEPTGSYDKL